MNHDGDDYTERPRRSARAAAADNVEARGEQATPQPSAREPRVKRSLDLDPSQRRELFRKAARVSYAVPGSTMSGAIRAVASEARVVVVSEDRNAFTQAVFRRLKHLRDCPSEREAAENEEEDPVTAAAITALRSETEDRIRRRNKPPSSSERVTRRVPSEAGGYHGAASFSEYQEAMRRVIATGMERVESGESLRKAALEAHGTLREEGIAVSMKTLHRLIARSKTAGEVMVPERPGDCAVPSHLENRLVAMVTDMKERELPVFAGDVITWCTELIAGTPSAANFQDGIATEAWFRAFLKRHKLTTADIPFSRTAPRISVVEAAAVAQPPARTPAERMARMSREELLHLCRTQAQAIDDLVEALSTDDPTGSAGDGGDGGGGGDLPAGILQKLQELASRQGNDGAGLAHVQEKIEQRRADEAERQAKAAERDSRREAQTVSLVTTGERLLGEIRASGIPAVVGCTVPDLKALLKHANPEGAVDTGAKKEALLIRVMALSSVQDAIATHFGRPPSQPMQQLLL